jgi:maleylpyruvate isomerase
VERFDPAPASAEIAEATARLLGTIATMSDDDARGPSLLPGWSRGHVLAHIARNADGLRNLLLGAIEGVERKAYPSAEARDSDIEAGARRPIKEHLADIEAAHARFMQTAAEVPSSAWGFILAWGSAGQKRQAREVLDARLREVAIHHVDLDAGYAASDWPPNFALLILRSALPAFEARGLAPCTLRATDVSEGVVRANGGSDVEVSGPAHALVMWLLGRASGAGLTTTGGELPAPPAWV